MINSTFKQQISWFKDALTNEAHAILSVSDRTHPESILRAIDLIVQCKGKVLILGVGKSGLIGRKIAATMSSMGTAAFFLHACDSLHGDLGVIESRDVAIMISHSGESEEILTLMPHLHRRGVPIIAITGNLNSTLSREADTTIDSGISVEACHLNLAPTTSSTTALAVGDALAIVVARIRGFTKDSFALNHPAGRLGKRLTLKVSDLMHSDDRNPTIKPNASIVDVVLALGATRLGALNVVDDNGCLIGIITEGDLRRALSKCSPVAWPSLRVDSIMTRNPITVEPNHLAFEALKIMENRASQILVLPVINQNGYCVGLLRLHDIVKSGL